MRGIEAIKGGLAALRSDIAATEESIEVIRKTGFGGPEAVARREQRLALQKGKLEALEWALEDDPADKSPILSRGLWDQD